MDHVAKHCVFKGVEKMMFADFARAAGLIPGDVIADGRWRRCGTESHPKKRNASYKLATDGRIGWIQDFAQHAEPLTWRPEGAEELPRIDFAAIERRKSEARRVLINATNAARRFYFECEPLRGGHPYLSAHGLQMHGCRGLMVDSAGWLVVPVMIERNLMSVQRISPDGEKKFWPGASVKAASYAIERPSASITVLCEGLATGLAIFAAAPLTRVVVAFNAGNLAKVSIPRRGLVVVAADNDHVTEAKIGRNPGLIAAQEAADELGCGVALPTGIAGTDWADWREEMTAKRLADKPYNQGATRRAVDAEIAVAMSRNARFLRTAVAA